MIGCVCGPIGSSMPSLIAGVAGPPDADDPAVLDPDVRLDDADERIDDERAGDDDVELRRAGSPLGRARAGWSSRSPRSARRRAPGGPPRPGPRGRCRRAGRGRRSSGRSERAVPPARARFTVPPRRRRRTGPGARSASRRVPSARSSRPAGRGGSRSRPRGRTRGGGSPARTGSARRHGSTRVDSLRTSSSMRRSRLAGRRRGAGRRPDRPRAVVAGAVAERVEQHHEPRPVVHQDLERDLVDERGDARRSPPSASTASRPAASTSA